jgi:transporter family-2 protein
VTWIIFLIALGAGAANPFQSATNAELNRQLRQPLWAAIVVYASGLAGLLLAQLFVRAPIPVAQAAGVHWWAWTGGAISLVSTIIGLMLVQRLGSGLFTSLSITASLLTSVLLDQFGLVGLRQHTASPARLVGCALLISGVWLVARS